MITIATITCRRNPRLAMMAASIAAAARRVEARVQWLIVDELLWDDELAEERRQHVKDAVGEMGLLVRHAPPKPSRWRGPHWDAPMPDQNNARNSALALIDPDEYVLFLDDCTAITIGTLGVVEELGAGGLGFAANLAFEKRLNFDPSAFQYRSSTGRMAKRLPTTVAGGCFGAPAAAFAAIRGFDEAYGGEEKCEDLDAILRLSRTGIDFYSSPLAWAVQVADTHSKEEVTASQEALLGRRNRHLFSNVKRDRRRFMPAGEQPSIAELRELMATAQIRPEVVAPRGGARPAAPAPEAQTPPPFFYREDTTTERAPEADTKAPTKERAPEAEADTKAPPATPSTEAPATPKKGKGKKRKAKKESVSAPRGDDTEAGAELGEGAGEA